MLKLFTSGACSLPRDFCCFSRRHSLARKSLLVPRSVYVDRQPFFSGQNGFTLIEMVATLALLGILLAMATGGLTFYFSAKSLEASAREITSEIREAQAMAVATGNSYRIDFSASNGYSLLRRQGSSWIQVHGPIHLEGGVVFSASSPPAFGEDEPRYMDFYAKGTSEGGQLMLDGRFGKTRLLQVVGESVNVTVTP